MSPAARRSRSSWSVSSRYSALVGARDQLVEHGGQEVHLDGCRKVSPRRRATSCRDRLDAGVPARRVVGPAAGDQWIAPQERGDDQHDEARNHEPAAAAPLRRPARGSASVTRTPAPLVADDADSVLEADRSGGTIDVFAAMGAGGEGSGGRWHRLHRGRVRRRRRAERPTRRAAGAATRCRPGPPTLQHPSRPADTRNMAWRASGLRLFGWYVLASAIPISLLGLGLAHQYQTQMNRRALDQAASEADAIANAGIEPVLVGRALAKPFDERGARRSSSRRRAR